VKKHYLNLSGYQEGKAIWKITPILRRGKKIVAFD